MKIYSSIYIVFIIVCGCLFATVGYSEKIIEKPRVIIDIQEEINGIKDDKSASNWVKERSADYGLRIVEADKTDAIAAKRADILGRNNEASLRKEGLVSNYDYFIQGKVSGHQGKEKGLYGSKDGIRFSLGMEMSVIEAATGEVIATTVIPPQDILVRNVASEQAATREAVNRLMKGNDESIGAEELFRKMRAHWASEKHSGELYRMEFYGLDLENADLLKNALSSISDINEPRVCSVDTAGISVLECQTKLKSLDLASLVQKTITGFKLDRSDAHYLSFRKNRKTTSVLKNPTNEVALVIPNKKEIVSSGNNSHVVIEVKSSSWFDKFWEPFFVKMGAVSTTLLVGACGALKVFLKKCKLKSNSIKNE